MKPQNTFKTPPKVTKPKLNPPKFEVALISMVRKNIFWGQCERVK